MKLIPHGQGHLPPGQVGPDPIQDTSRDGAVAALVLLSPLRRIMAKLEAQEVTKKGKKEKKRRESLV